MVKRGITFLVVLLSVTFVLITGLGATAIGDRFFVSGVAAAAELEPGTFTRAHSEPTVLRVTTTELRPFVFEEGGRLTGFYWEIWEAAATSLGVEYEVMIVEAFPDVLEALRSRVADVGVAPIAPTSEREAFMDFTIGIVRSGAQLGVSPEWTAEPSLWRTLLDSTLLRIVGSAVLVVLLVSHLIWFIERRKPQSDFRRSYLKGVWDAFWWALVTLTTVGYGDKKPKSVAGRLIAMVWMLFTLFLVGAFVAQVTSTLTIERMESSVESVDDLRDERIAVIGGTTFEAFLMESNIDCLPVTRQGELFEAVRSGDAAALVTNPYSLTFLAREDYPDVVEPIGDVFVEEFETIGLTNDSPWREQLNVALLDLRKEGVVDSIVSRWFPEM